MNLEKFKGVGVALVTPFNNNLEVDYAQLSKLVEYVVTGGVDYLVVLGTTGESATLTLDEKKKILQTVKEANNGRKPIVLGVGGNNTNHVLEMFSQFDFSGVDGVLSVSPYYNKPPQEGIYQHYVKVADKSPKPVILYNVPGRTSSNLAASTTLRLAEHKNIIGIKEASGNIDQCMLIAKDKPADFMLISGEDLHTTAMISFRCCGVISVLANAFPKMFSDMIHKALQNDHKSASEMLFQFLEINPLMYAESNPVGVKAALNVMGITSSKVRLPLVEASDKLKSEIKIQIEKYNLK